MRHYLVIPIIAAALAGCAGLGDEDRALIDPLPVYVPRGS